jgi:hypothetical protein
MVLPPHCISLLTPVVPHVLVLVLAQELCRKRVALAAVADQSPTIKGSSRCRRHVDHVVVKGPSLNIHVPRVEVQALSIDLAM